MTERKEKYIQRSSSEFTIGKSIISWNEKYIEFKIDEITSPLPTKVQGVVRVHPQYINSKVFHLTSDEKHSWWPIAPYSIIEVELKKPTIKWSGVAYLDANWGDEPLENGFKDWNWLCTRNNNEDRCIQYHTNNRNGDVTSLGLNFDNNGNVTEQPFTRIQNLPNTKVWKIARQACVDENQNYSVSKTLEDTPFYSRSILHSEFQKKSILTMHESLDLNRFRSPWTQLMLPFKMPRTIF